MADNAEVMDKIRRATATLYKHGRIDSTGVAKAVDANLVKAADYKDITGSEYAEAKE